MEGVLHLEGSVKATKLKLTWLPDIPGNFYALNPPARALEVSIYFLHL